ncbi:MAG TPA: hypothetical protein VG944_21485 [Fimbriimonas sp.]|nr:hypothetical protein [Fimbriimonas sp.]
MVSLVGISIALALSAQTQEAAWLAPWHEILAHHPIAYYRIYNRKTQQFSIEFIDRSGRSIGRLFPPTGCQMSMSPDDRLAEFKIAVDLPGAGATHELVVNEAGEVAAADVSVIPLHTFWTDDNKLAFYGAADLQKAVPKEVCSADGKFVVSTAVVRSRFAEIHRAGIGGQAYACFASSLMLGVVIWPPPPRQGAFWLDSDLTHRKPFLEGAEVGSLASSPSGAYLAVITGSGPEHLVILKSQNQSVVKDQSFPSIDGLALFQWRPEGHCLATSMQIGDGQPTDIDRLLQLASKDRTPARISLYDVDTGRTRQFPVPMSKFVQGLWLDSNRILAVGRVGNRGKAAEILDTRTGAWTFSRYLENSAEVQDLRQ